MTMRKIAFCTCLILLAGLLLPGCSAKQTNTPSPTANAPTTYISTEPDPTEPTPTLPAIPSGPSEPKVTPSETTSSDDELRQIADLVLKEQYGITQLDCFEIEVDQYKNGNAMVCYELFIQGYDTNSELWVKFDANGQVSSVQTTNDFNDYIKFLPYATPEAVGQAVVALDALIGGADRPHANYYCDIDQQGYLCLATEIIVYIETPETDNDGNIIFDHEHTFPSVRICRLP